MEDTNDSEEDIPLPPLPAKPQKTLFSFFGKSKSNIQVKLKNKKKSASKQEEPDFVDATKSNAEQRILTRNDKLQKPADNDICNEHEVTDNESPVKHKKKKGRPKKVVESDDDENSREQLQGQSNVQEKNVVQTLRRSSRHTKHCNSSITTAIDLLELTVTEDLKQTRSQSESESDLELIRRKSTSDLKKLLNYSFNESLVELIDPEKSIDVIIDKNEVHQKEFLSAFRREGNGTIEAVECTEPTPFPETNHIQQLTEKNNEMKDSSSNKMKLKVMYEDKSPVSFLSTTIFNYRSLLTIEDGRDFNQDEVNQRSLEGCLAVLKSDYPDFPVKKVFMQYLACQRSVITKNLEKIESSKQALRTIWEEDAKLKSTEAIQAALNEKRNEEIAAVDAAVGVKKKEGKDIRSLFSNAKKKNKQKPLSNEKISGTAELNEKDESKSVDKWSSDCDRKMKVKTMRERKKNDKIEQEKSNQPFTTEEEGDDETECNTRPGGISINGLFGKVRKKRKKRKSRNKNEQEKVDSVEILTEDDNTDWQKEIKPVKENRKSTKSTNKSEDVQNQKKREHSNIESEETEFTSKQAKKVSSNNKKRINYVENEDESGEDSHNRRRSKRLRGQETIMLEESSITNKVQNLGIQYNTMAETSVEKQKCTTTKERKDMHLVPTKTEEIKRLFENDQISEEKEAACAEPEVDQEDSVEQAKQKKTDTKKKKKKSLHENQNKDEAPEKVVEKMKKKKRSKIQETQDGPKNHEQVTQIFTLKEDGKKFRSQKKKKTSKVENEIKEGTHNRLRNSQLTEQEVTVFDDKTNKEDDKLNMQTEVAEEKTTVETELSEKEVLVKKKEGKDLRLLFSKVEKIIDIEKSFEKDKISREKEVAHVDEKDSLEQTKENKTDSIKTKIKNASANCNKDDTLVKNIKKVKSKKKGTAEESKIAEEDIQKQSDKEIEKPSTTQKESMDIRSLFSRTENEIDQTRKVFNADLKEFSIEMDLNKEIEQEESRCNDSDKIALESKINSYCKEQLPENLELVHSDLMNVSCNSEMVTKMEVNNSAEIKGVGNVEIKNPESTNKSLPLESTTGDKIINFNVYSGNTILESECICQKTQPDKRQQYHSSNGAGAVKPTDTPVHSEEDQMNKQDVEATSTKMNEPQNDTKHDSFQTNDTPSTISSCSSSTKVENIKTSKNKQKKDIRSFFVNTPKCEKVVKDINKSSCIVTNYKSTEFAVQNQITVVESNTETSCDNTLTNDIALPNKNIKPTFLIDDGNSLNTDVNTIILNSSEIEPVQCTNSTETANPLIQDKLSSCYENTNDNAFTKIDSITVDDEVISCVIQIKKMKSVSEDMQDKYDSSTCASEDICLKVGNKVISKTMSSQKETLVERAILLTDSLKQTEVDSKVDLMNGMEENKPPSEEEHGCNTMKSELNTSKGCNNLDTESLLTDKRLTCSNTNNEIVAKSNANVTSCKVKVEEIIFPCKVVAEDVSPLHKKLKKSSAKKSHCAVALFPEDVKAENEEEKENVEHIDAMKSSKKSAKRKSLFIESNAPKKIKTDATVEPIVRRRSLRNREKMLLPDDKMQNNKEENMALTVQGISSESSEIIEHTEDNNSSMETIANVVTTTERSKKRGRPRKKLRISLSETSATEKPVEEETSEETPLNFRRSTRTRKKAINYYELGTNGGVANDNSLEHKDSPVPAQKSREELGETLATMEMPEHDVQEANEELVQGIVSLEKKEALKRTMDTLDLLKRSPCKTKPVVEVILDENVMNSFLSWTEKYQPCKARFVIGERLKIKELFTWLNSWKERHESIVKKMAARAARENMKDEDTDSEFDSDSDDDEDNLSNTLMLTGPSGCGTTAAIYACAKQMDFKVLELNPSIYRTGKRIFDQVSEAVVSHQVRKGIKKQQRKSMADELKDAAKGTKSLAALFSANKTTNTKNKDDVKLKSYQSSTMVDAMSLVLFEQIDIIYEELDKGFWQGLTDLRQLSKRPIILTANDPKVLQEYGIEDDTWIEHISLALPSADQILPMMQLMCLVEQIYVRKHVLHAIINFCKHDVRKIILQLQFWFEQGKEPLFNIWKPKNKRKNKEAGFGKIVNTKDDSEQHYACDQDDSIVEVQSSASIVVDTEDADRKMDEDSCRMTFTDNVAIKTQVSESVRVDKVDTDKSTVCEAMEVDVENVKCSKVEQCEMTCSSKTDNLSYEGDNLQGTSNGPSISDAGKSYDVMIPEASLNIFPVYRQQFLSKQKILDCNGFITKLSKHYTFLTDKKHEPASIQKMEASSTKLKVLANSVDVISEMDSIMTIGRRYEDKDHYLWTGKLCDSLEDSLTKKKEFINPYPIEEMFESVKTVTEECYGYFTEQDDVKFDFMQNKVTDEFVDFYTSIESSLPTSSVLDRKSVSLDVIPCLKNICQSEEMKRVTQQRRKSRRFLHYLDSVGMYLNETVMARLAVNQLSD